MGTATRLRLDAAPAVVADLAFPAGGLGDDLAAAEYDAPLVQLVLELGIEGSHTVEDFCDLSGQALGTHVRFGQLDHGRFDLGWKEREGRQDGLGRDSRLLSLSILGRSRGSGKGLFPLRKASSWKCREPQTEWGSVRPLLPRLSRLADLPAGLLLLASVLASTAAGWWLTGVMEHLRLQEALLLGLAVLLAWASGRPRMALLWLGGVVLNLIFLLPLYWGGGPAPSPGPPLRLVAFNVHITNLQHDRILAWLEGVEADAVVLEEVSTPFLTRVERESKRWKVSASRGRRDSRGIALLLPVDPAPGVEFENARIIHLLHFGENPPVVEAHLRWADREVVLYGVHCFWPVGRDAAAEQRAEFQALARLLKQSQDGGRSVIVLGDLNTTPWSVPFRSLLRDGVVKDSSRGYGLQCSWHGGPGGLVALPIDHALASPDLVAVGRGIGPELGSDHRPLRVEFRPVAPSSP